MKSANSVFSLLVAAGAVALVVACTKTVTRIVPTEGDAGTSSGDGGKPSTIPSGDDDDTTGPDASDDASTEPVVTAASCKKTTTTQDDCVQCCAGIEQAGYNKYAGFQRTCICKPDLCATDCKTTYCKTVPTNPNAVCNTCAQSNIQACGDEVSTDCTADTECAKFNKCLMDATCPTKPTQ